MLFLISILPFACSKEKANKGPYYDQFIGKWSSVGSSEKEQIEVKSNGVIRIYYELERAKQLLVTKWTVADTTTFAGNTWIWVSFRGKYETGLTLYRDFTGDTLITGSSAPNVINGVLVKPEKYKRFVKTN